MVQYLELHEKQEGITALEYDVGVDYDDGGGGGGGCVVDDAAPASPSFAAAWPFFVILEEENVSIALLVKYTTGTYEGNSASIRSLALTILLCK